MVIFLVAIEQLSSESVSKSGAVCLLSLHTCFELADKAGSKHFIQILKEGPLIFSSLSFVNL